MRKSLTIYLNTIYKMKNVLKMNDYSPQLIKLNYSMKSSSQQKDDGGYIWVAR